MGILEALGICGAGLTPFGRDALESVQDHPERWSMDSHYARRERGAHEAAVLVLSFALGADKLSVCSPFWYDMNPHECRLIWQALDVVRLRQVRGSSHDVPVRISRRETPAEG